MAGIIDNADVPAETPHAASSDVGKTSRSRLWPDLLGRVRLGIGLVLVMAAGIVVGMNAAAWWRALTSMTPPAQLRWLIAMLPGSIIINHMIYVLFSRRKQFSEALSP